MSGGEIEVRYHVVTPMACRGAETSKPFPRPSSFRGVMRFWWRAVAWGLWGGDTKKIQKMEEQLFGSARLGRGMVGIDAVEAVGNGEGSPGGGPGCSYMAGMGLGGRGRGTRMWGVRGRGELRVRLRLRRPAEKGGEELERLEDSLVLALEALGTFGGLGARSRRGWGSLGLMELKGRGVEGRELRAEGAEGLGGVVDKVRGIMQRCCAHQTNASLPPYTAFSPHTLVGVVGMDRGGPLDLLEEIGREMIRYRSSGYSTRGGEKRNALDEPPEENFKEDKELVFGCQGVAKRVIFGMPLQFWFRSTREAYTLSPAETSRRASPLFVHIHQINPSSSPVAVVSLIKADFLPSGWDIVIKEGGRECYRAAAPPEGELWAPVECFLLRLMGEAGRGCPSQWTKARHDLRGRWAWPVDGG